MQPDDALAVSEETYQQLYAFARREVRRLGRNHTLNATALVNEAWIKLAHGEPGWNSREHFVATMARVMRHLLIDHLRRKKAIRHGGDAMRITITGLDESDGQATRVLDLLAVDVALRKLGELDRRLELIAELRFFGGLSVEESASALLVSTATIKRETRAARAFLALELGH